MILESELDRLQKYLPIERELIRAKKIHPDNPKDELFQLAVMIEEAGEVAKAVLDYRSKKCDKKHIREELIQTAAMCMRMLENMEDD